MSNVSVKLFRQGEKDEDNTGLIIPYQSESVSTPLVTPSNGKALRQQRCRRTQLSLVSLQNTYTRCKKPRSAQCSTERFRLYSFPSPYPPPSLSLSTAAQALFPDHRDDLQVRLNPLQSQRMPQLEQGSIELAFRCAAPGEES